MSSRTLATPARHRAVHAAVVTLAAFLAWDAIADDVCTSFETQPTGICLTETVFAIQPPSNFTIGTSPIAATFAGGEVMILGIGAYYHSGTHSWHVGPGVTATISFETPASSIELFFRDTAGGGPSHVRVVDTDDVVVLTSADGTQFFQQVEVNKLPVGQALIDRIEVVNSSDVADVVIDDVSFESFVPELACAAGASCTSLVTFVNPGSNSTQQSFLRFVHKAATPTDIQIRAFDDDGFVAPGGIVETTLDAFASLQLTAQDLEQGNAAKDIFGSLGNGTGKWQLAVESNGSIEVMSLIRTPDGFLTSVNDTTPKDLTNANEIFYANPASNQNQLSFLRFVNQSDVDGFVTLTGVDDSGNLAPGTDVTFSLFPKESKQLSSRDYENGNGAKGLSGALGDGNGKWHLTATSDVDLEVMSLIRTPDGFLTNLSGVAPTDAAGDHHIYYANPASETRQATLIRVVNRTTSTGNVTIAGIDDDGTAAPGGVVQFQLGPLEAKQLLATDLENGNTSKGLTGALGSPGQTAEPAPDPEPVPNPVPYGPSQNGASKWQLTVTADMDIAVMNLIRTADGFLTNLSRVAPKSAPNTTEIYLFNPGSNTNQRSLLRVVNTTGETGRVTITGADDNGDAAPGGPVSFQIGANQGIVLTVQDLENGNASIGLSGALGDGAGKWNLTVESTVKVAMMSLLDTPNGFITNLSRPSEN